MKTEFTAAATTATATPKSIWHFAAGGALLVAWLFMVPFSPGFPAADGDSPWKYALNEAIARGDIFGRDVIFTFGPLASIIRKSTALQPTQ